MLRFLNFGSGAEGPLRRIVRRKTALERSSDFESELMQIVGPEDGSCVCSDWLGAVVSVTGKNDAFPTLDAAVRDGLFHEGCRHRLVKFTPNREHPEKDAEAIFCTESAVRAMRSRGGQDSVRRRQAFESLYKEAREADQDRRYDAAREKCAAALDLIREKNVFGDQQERVERALKARIRTIEAAVHDSDSRPGTHHAAEDAAG